MFSLKDDILSETTGINLGHVYHFEPMVQSSNVTDYIYNSYSCSTAERTSLSIKLMAVQTPAVFSEFRHC